MKKILLSGAALALLASAANAADAPSKKKGPIAPPTPAWMDTLSIDGYVEGSVTVNPSQPYNGLNWGHLYSDRANTPTFNGLLTTIQRPLDPKATGFDYGFKIQTQLGADARYNHYYGELDYLIHDRTQFAIIEAHALAHLPIITSGGVDVKVGQFATYNGFEVMPAKDNLLYSHTYMFNFGPFKHTGVMITTHAYDWLDIYTGVTTGLNTSIGWPGDNNNSPSFHGGIGLNLLDGKLTILGFTHAGPENAKQTDPLGVGWSNIPLACSCSVSSTWRYYNNLTTTYKPNDNLTLALDLSYMREDGWNGQSFTGLNPAQLAAFGGPFGAAPFNAPPFTKPTGADAYGAAGYVSYKFNDLVKVTGRAEYFRDNKNFFVAAYPGYHDSVNAAHGFVSQTIFRPVNAFTGNNNGTSYLALTLGATITPDLPKIPYISGLIIRPELRWDVALNGSSPFFGPLATGFGGVGGTSRNTQGLAMVDVIVPFTIK